MQQQVGPQTSQRGSQALSIASKEGTQHISLQQLFEQLHTSEKGLTSEEARQKLKEVGPNELGTVQRLTGLKQLLLLFTNPLVLILLVASIVSAVFGEVLDASIIIVIVLLSIALNYFQTNRSERAVEGLRKQVALTAGDLAPADARLIQSVDLNVQQAALTGESLPVEKDASDSAPTSGNLADARSSVFLGTSIVSGSATAVVTATGKNTAFGDIVAHLAKRPPQTEFEHGIKKFSLLISRTVFFLVVFVFLVGIIFHKGTLDSALFAISLAVGLTPEFLPMIVTITLAQGASRMAKEKVIVKHLESMQNFGSIDVLCSDKTGTLTTGEMALSNCFDPQGQPSKRVLLFAYLNSFYETGIKSPLDAAVLRYEQLDVSSYRKLGEIPFDFERRRLSVVVEQEQNGEPLLICKGAPESVLSVCSKYERDGQCIPLDDTAHTMCKETY
jgi:P-type Mg2+ transporter